MFSMLMIFSKVYLKNGKGKVVIADNLSLKSHMSAEINMANSTIGVRHTYTYLGEESFLLRYIHVALIRPHLEYAHHVWAPHLNKDITAIENVQKRAPKLIPE